MNDYLGRTPLALAHRGGAGLPQNAGIENTIGAFANAVELGYSHLEVDVRASSDGVVYVFHDSTLARLTGDPRGLNSLHSSEVDRLTLSGGESIPRLEALLDRFPDTHFNVDFKSDDVVDSGLRLIREMRAEDRVLAASFSHRRLQAIRRHQVEVPTSASVSEVAAWVLGAGRITRMAQRNGAVCFQVPRTSGWLPVVTSRTLERAHDQGLQVHVWTIDSADEITELLDLGVDGIVTDRPDVLREVLQQRDQW